MTDLPGKFIEEWHSAVEERSFDKVNALLADDVKLVSPVAFKPFTDRAYILKVLENVVRTLESFRYTRSTVLSDGGVLMVFEGEIDGKTLEGIDLFDLNAEGKVETLKVMVRPFRVYAKFAFTMGERMGIRNWRMSVLKFLMR
ncbi:MAG: nuclear transport factor 2 family protein [Woeseiaceae bacterium]|nr:nuclear transport factor 2 family protein [Woeseiaceae bacterium]